MGDQVTVKGMKVVAVDVANNLLAVSGAVPGPRKGLVMIKGADLMSQAIAYSKTGAKQEKKITLPAAVFSVESDHKLVGQAHRTYLANGRSAGAVVLNRGDVRGGGKKPWRRRVRVVLVLVRAACRTGVAVARSSARPASRIINSAFR